VTNNKLGISKVDILNIILVILNNILVIFKQHFSHF
jgi:hypothetical protein